MAIKVIALEGSHNEMGYKYGFTLRNELSEALNVLKEFYITLNNMTYPQMLEQAELFNDRYSYTYSFFLQGIASGSGLSLDDVKILNGMETIVVPEGTHRFSETPTEFTETELGACSFVFLPPSKTYSGSALIGRNYDYGEPFKSIAQNLIVTIIKTTDHQPTAIIGLPGQIYCPTCVNSKGLFMELNNAMPSGGYYVEQNRQSLLINMLHMEQNSDSLTHLAKQLFSSSSDYSLIINIANNETVKSFEYSSNLGLKTFDPESGEVFISTNFYQNETWQDIPVVTDENSWFSVTRYNNLVSQANAKEQFNIQEFQSMLNAKILEGGSAWPATIYQIIFDTSNNDLYLTRNGYDSGEWMKISLAEYF